MYESLEETRRRTKSRMTGTALSAAKAKANGEIATLSRTTGYVGEVFETLKKHI